MTRPRALPNKALWHVNDATAALDNADALLRRVLNEPLTTTIAITCIAQAALAVKDAKEHLLNATSPSEGNTGEGDIEKKD
jgi:hypothetical protein